MSHQAVYDVLHALADGGLVRRIQPAGSVARYELRVGDNHHHLVCRCCGDVVDVDCASARHRAWTPRTSTYVPRVRMDEAEVIYWGLCATCAGSASPSPT